MSIQNIVPKGEVMSNLENECGKTNKVLDKEDIKATNVQDSSKDLSFYQRVENMVKGGKCKSKKEFEFYQEMLAMVDAIDSPSKDERQ